MDYSSPENLETLTAEKKKYCIYQTLTTCDTVTVLLHLLCSVIFGTFSLLNTHMHLISGEKGDLFVISLEGLGASIFILVHSVSITYIFGLCFLPLTCTKVKVKLRDLVHLL